MNELEQNKPEGFWKKAFDEASEMPPPRVWDAIERRLDKSEEGIITGPKIVPLWDSGLISSNRFAWSAGIAAALALLLIGWWSLSADSDQKPIAQYRSVRQPQPQSTGTLPARPAQTPDVAVVKIGVGSPVDITETAEKSLTQAGVKSDHRDAQSVMSASMASANVAARTIHRPTPEIQALNPFSTAPVIMLPSTNQLTYGAQPTLYEVRSMMNRVASVAFASTTQPTTNQSQADPLPVITVEQLAGRSIQQRNLEPIHRIVWVSPVPLPTEEKVTQPTQQHRDAWASVSIIPGTFDPSVSVRSAQVVSSQAYANATMLNSSNSSAGSSQPMVNSRVGWAMAYQAITGVQLTPRWSVEGGVGYLSGRSSVESPAQVTAYSTHPASAINRVETTGNLYVNALRNSLPVNYKSTVADIAAYQSQVSYDAQSPQTLTNNYRFVQVPVQVGYQLRPRKRFGLAVLGGFLTNIFVRNTVGDNVVINSKDGVYRPLSWSATLGARFRYRPSRRWSASLAGLYQTAFGSGTESTSQVQNHLSATGMSFGVDYHF